MERCGVAPACRGQGSWDTVLRDVGTPGFLSWNVSGRTGCQSSRVSILLHGRMQVPADCTPDSGSPMGWAHLTHHWGSPSPALAPRGRFQPRGVGVPAVPSLAQGLLLSALGSPSRTLCRRESLRLRGTMGTARTRQTLGTGLGEARGSSCSRALSCLSPVPAGGARVPHPTLAAPGAQLQSMPRGTLAVP